MAVWLVPLASLGTAYVAMYRTTIKQPKQRILEQLRNIN